MSSTTSALEALLATHADVDDLLRAAALAPRAKRRARAQAQRRSRSIAIDEPADQAAAERLAAAGREPSRHG
jgi:D-serine deaminase-like pyridoxal phosphate-dependent protein